MSRRLSPSLIFKKERHIIYVFGVDEICSNVHKNRCLSKKKKKKFIKITNNNLDKVKAPEKWPKSKRPLQAKFLRKKQTGVGENSDPRMGPVFDGRLDTGLARTPRPIGAVRLYFFF